MEPRSPDSQNGALEQASPFPLQGQVAPTPRSSFPRSGKRRCGRPAPAPRPARGSPARPLDTHGASRGPPATPGGTRASGRPRAARSRSPPRRRDVSSPRHGQNTVVSSLGRRERLHLGASSPARSSGVQPDTGAALAETARKPTSPRSFPE